MGDSWPTEAPPSSRHLQLPARGPTSSPFTLLLASLIRPSNRQNSARQSKPPEPAA